MISRDKLALTALCAVEEISLKKKETVLSLLDSPGDAFSGRYSGRLKDVLADHYDEFVRQLACAEETCAKYEHMGMTTIAYFDEEYPALLREIQASPVMLYAKGDIGLMNTDCIAVVGTRRPTRYGMKATETFASEFARAGLTVVSGFARGVDRIAHEACVRAGAPTIAVFACGLDVCYPAEHRGLYDGILSSGGLVISEYPPGIKPLQYHFPERNRIISGLSRGVFVPEAAVKSGSLITARLAVEQNRDLYVIPGNINSPESEGTNRLLMEMPHAMVLSPEDVLSDIGRTSAPREERTVELDLTETLIAECLREGEMHFEEIMQKTGIGINELNTALINLQLNGIVEDCGGNYYNLN